MDRDSLEIAKGFIWGAIISSALWAGYFLVTGFSEMVEEKAQVCRNQFGHRVECDD